MFLTTLILSAFSICHITSANERFYEQMSSDNIERGNQILYCFNDDYVEYVQNEYVCLSYNDNGEYRDLIRVLFEPSQDRVDYRITSNEIFNLNLYLTLEFYYEDLDSSLYKFYNLDLTHNLDIEDYLLFAQGINLDDLLLTFYCWFNINSTYSEEDFAQLAIGNYERGYIEGQATGFISGYQDGRSDGYSTGYTLGYNQGVVVGSEGNNDFGFINLFGAIADTPIMMLYSLFNFDLFGVKVLTVILSLFTGLMLVFVIRKFIQVALW